MILNNQRIDASVNFQFEFGLHQDDAALKIQVNDNGDGLILN